MTAAVSNVYLADYLGFGIVSYLLFLQPGSQQLTVSSPRWVRLLKHSRTA